MNYLQRRSLKIRKQYCQQRYVNYRKEAVVEKLHKEDLVERVDWLIKNNYQFIKHTTLRENIKPMTYSLTYNDRLIKLSYFDGQKHYFCPTNYHDDQKNAVTPNSFKAFKKMFRERNGKRLTEAFGKTSQSFKLYCPRPLYYFNTLYEIGTWYNGVSKEDYSSHYPWASLGKLPDATTMIEIEGYVKPNKDFPFAFYPDSGNVAVYNEFDSHEWTKYVRTYSANIKKIQHDPNYEAVDEHTILMAESDYSLVDEIMHFYNIKDKCKKDSEDYHNAKMFLLKFIGMMEQCNPQMYISYPFAHLAAVIKWRANIRMFKTLKTIGSKNVIQVCVDGVIHKGEPVGDNKHCIGSLNTEFTGAKFVHRGINQYIIKDGVKEERKHAGLDINTDSNKIMHWSASPKVDFINYMKINYLMEEVL